MTRSPIEGDDLDRRNLTDPIHLGGVVEVTVDEDIDAVLELATDAVGTSVCVEVATQVLIDCSTFWSRHSDKKGTSLTAHIRVARSVTK